MRRCGNCNQVGHNRRTCSQAGSFQPILRSTAPKKTRRRKAIINPVVNTLYNCPGINGIGRHTVYVLESDSSISFVMDKQGSMRGGGGGAYHCPKHGCFMTLA